MINFQKFEDEWVGSELFWSQDASQKSGKCLFTISHAFFGEALFLKRRSQSWNHTLAVLVCKYFPQTVEVSLVSANWPFGRPWSTSHTGFDFEHAYSRPKNVIFLLFPDLMRHYSTFYLRIFLHKFVFGRVLIYQVVDINGPFFVKGKFDLLHFFWAVDVSQWFRLFIFFFGNIVFDNIAYETATAGSGFNYSLI